jgi:hypothetical protein
VREADLFDIAKPVLADRGRGDQDLTLTQLHNLPLPALWQPEIERTCHRTLLKNGQ